MANLNRVALIGRLTRDPEIKTFDNGGKVAHIGFAVHNRRRNAQTGAWEEVPVWVDLKAFNRESGRKLADLAEKYLRKGQQAYFEGHLALEEWQRKDDGKKQSKLLVYVDAIQFLEKKDAAPPAAGAELEDVPF
ncbi:MAG: single-stranded DNA-binding protein [Elusimicrobia bacterium]|nr:single-stranded DNA-binding protein [Elusimicrobiota bacterium]